MDSAATALLYSLLTIATLHLEASIGLRTDKLNGGARLPASDGAECDRGLAALTADPAETLTPPRLQGLWVSAGCEIRPGPEFVTRRYQFSNDTHFSALQFYYSDSSCRDAFYGLEARGYLKMEGNSMPAGLLDWRSSAYELFRPPMLLQVTVMPYTESAAHFLQAKVTSSDADCRRRFQRPDERQWSPGGAPYHLLLYVEYRGRVMRDFDCTRQLGFNLHEMQLVRTELAADRKRRLYLGDLATSFNQRHRHRPSSFQEPLEDATTADCDTCLRVSRASLRRPPALPWRALLTPGGSPLGEWISVRCESRPQSNYLIRRLRFLPASTSNSSLAARWTGEYHHFHDPLCRRPYFSVTASGWVTANSPDSLLPAARQFDFRIVGLAITPRDARSLDQLTAYDGFGCGRRSDWRLNRAQDVTSTNGCDHFGLQVPSTSEQVMMEELLDGGRALLWVGAIPNSLAGVRGSAPERSLPTSFQAPLIGCREFDDRPVRQPSSASSAAEVAAAAVDRIAASRAAGTLLTMPIAGLLCGLLMTATVSFVHDI